MYLRAILSKCSRQIVPSFCRHQRLLCSVPHHHKFNDPNPLAAEAERILTAIDSPSPNDPSLKRALSLLEDAISQESPRAKTLLASMHNAGLCTDPDEREASRLFCEAAEEGDPVAQYSLGVLGLEQVKAQEEAIGANIKSTDFVVDIDDKGEMRGRLELEREDGSQEEAPRPADLVRRVRKARRKAGFTDQESKEYENHRAEERQKQLTEQRNLALLWLERSADQGHDEAMVTLGNELIQEDPIRAVELYERAVKTSRNTDAYYNLGQIYTKGLEDISPDPKLAYRNFAMAAQLGDVSAQFYLGHLYRVGSREVEVDLASSRQYIEMAAEQGHPGALHYLALMHRNGEGGLEVNNGAFQRYLSASADAGHGPAFSFLGEMHYKGTDGTDVDYEKALSFFLKAGELQESDALCSAAAMYFHGFGTEEDHHQAFLLYQEAALLGNVQALRSIGSMYFYGHGVPANRTVAEHFFKAADENEAASQTEGTDHMNQPVERTPAPKHPMADIPQFVKSANDKEEDIDPSLSKTDEPLTADRSKD